MKFSARGEASRKNCEDLTHGKLTLGSLGKASMELILEPDLMGGST